MPGHPARGGVVRGRQVREVVRQDEEGLDQGKHQHRDHDDRDGVQDLAERAGDGEQGVEPPPFSQ